MMNNIINDLAYRGIGDKYSKRKTFLTKTLPKSVKDIQNKTFGEVMEISITSLNLLTIEMY